MKQLGIYVHIPFCSSKCYYCDFYSLTTNDSELIKKYFQTLQKEIVQTSNKKEYSISSIYIGGGTPSAIDSKYIKQTIECIEQHFIIEPNCEITIEINPNSKDILQKISDYFNIGCNRLSIGLQTTNTACSKYIGREVSVNQFQMVYDEAVRVGFNNISVDCITGLPNDTINSFVQTMMYVVSLPKVMHISMYSLEIHQQTPLYDICIKNPKLLPNEITERKMQHIAQKIMKKAGFKQYEISNFCKNNMKSQHNLKYWTLVDYIGIGVNASSMYKNKRYKNVANIYDYIEGAKKIIEEYTDALTLKQEYMMLNLRLVKGVNIDKYIELFHEHPNDKFENVINNLKLKKLLVVTTKHIRLSKRAYDVANIVWREFI